jgi:hypothetical protein
MGGISLTVSLRKDELEAIQKYMQETGATRHAAIKEAIRYFFLEM